MLSVCIPVYNSNVCNLVNSLMQQIEALNLIAQIIVVDDASPQLCIENRALSTNPLVTYEELPQNFGRSKIRNYLAVKAKYEYLLFLDGDSLLCHNQFLANYLKLTKPDTLLYGGTNYEKPKGKEYFLHYKYGVERECLPFEKRNKNPYGTFKTNNFFVPKAFFEKVKFNEKVKGYGHEDTLFAKDIERAGLKIIHIENAVLHDGLETATAFIEKQLNAIQNMAQLYKQGILGNEVRLIRFYEKIRKTRMIKLVKRFYLRDKELLIENLISDKPKLSNLDRLKLGLFLELVG